MSTTEHTPSVPAIDGWFTIDAEPHLVGTRCTGCGTVAFPPTEGLCRNPACRTRDVVRVPLARTGVVWSCTDAQYQPPPPYIATDPYEPFALAAVELSDEGLVVLGQVAHGYGVEDLHVGQPVELVVETLYSLDGVDHLIWRWRPLAAGRRQGR